MKNNIGKQLVISAIVAIFVFGIGYALLSDTITVTGSATTSGTLEIGVTNASWVQASSEGAGVSDNNSVSFETNGDTVTIAANVLEYPGATSTFTVELTNTGTLDGKVLSVTPTKENTNMTFTYTNLTPNETVIAGNNGTLIFTVTVGWLDTATTGFTNEEFELEILFQQD